MTETKPCPKCGHPDGMTGIILPQRWMAGNNKPDAYVCGSCGHEEKVK